MLKYITSILFAFIFSVNASSAQESAETRKAAKILNQVSKHYKTLKSLKTSFEIQITEPGAKKSSIEKGTLYLSGNKFKIELPDNEIVCNGKTQWFYMKGVNEVHISKYEPATDQITPNNIFTIYEKGFKYRWLEQKTEGANTVDIIELIPKDKQESKEYTKIKLTIDSKAKKILGSEIFYRSGRQMKYKLLDQVENIPVNDKFFEFDPNSKKGISVVDLQ